MPIRTLPMMLTAVWLLSIWLVPVMGQIATPSTEPVTAVATAPARPTASAAEVFKQLGALVGEWQGTFADGREHRVTYRLSAGGTVLVETWALAPGRESITLYHLDGDQLLATHYCPQGNQPRLRWVPGTDARRLSFVLKDGSNLHVPGGWHQHFMWLELGDANSYRRSETYIENGNTSDQAAKADAGEAIVYTRVTTKRSKSKLGILIQWARAHGV